MFGAEIGARIFLLGLGDFQDQIWALDSARKLVRGLVKKAVPDPVSAPRLPPVPRESDSSVLNGLCRSARNLHGVPDIHKLELPALMQQGSLDM